MSSAPFQSGREEAEKVYQTLFDDALSQFKRGLASYDSLLHPSNELNDTRRGLTLIARPNPEVLRHFSLVTQELNNVCPDQYIYPESDLHITMMSIVSCYSGYRFEDAHLGSYCRLISEALYGLKAIDIEFNGITASSECLMLKGFPLTDKLGIARRQLRQAFTDSTLENTLDKRYILKTAHSTCLRFVQPTINFKALIDFLNSTHHRQFDHLKINEISLVSNDWYMSKANTKTLATFYLK